MKVENYIIWTGLILIVAMQGCSALKGSTKEEKVAQEAALREAIEERVFRIEVDSVHPMDGSSRSLTSPYSLEINGDDVKSHLPFFGRAYTVPYGGGDGLIFESTVTDYQSTFDGQTTVIEFKTKSKEDIHTFRIRIHSTGSASIDVTSNNRQSISFTGKTNPKKVE